MTYGLDKDEHDAPKQPGKTTSGNLKSTVDNREGLKKTTTTRNSTAFKRKFPDRDVKVKAPTKSEPGINFVGLGKGYSIPQFLPTTTREWSSQQGKK